jgi:hypothetical protein
MEVEKAIRECACSSHPAHYLAGITVKAVASILHGAVAIPDVLSLIYHQYFSI